MPFPTPFGSSVPPLNQRDCAHACFKKEDLHLGRHGRLPGRTVLLRAPPSTSRTSAAMLCGRSHRIWAHLCSCYASVATVNVVLTLTVSLSLSLSHTHTHTHTHTHSLTHSLNPFEIFLQFVVARLSLGTGEVYSYSVHIHHYMFGKSEEAGSLCLLIIRL